MVPSSAHVTPVQLQGGTPPSTVHPLKLLAAENCRKEGPRVGVAGGRAGRQAGGQAGRRAGGRWAGGRRAGGRRAGGRRAGGWAGGQAGKRAGGRVGARADRRAGKPVGPPACYTTGRRPPKDALAALWKGMAWQGVAWRRAPQHPPRASFLPNPATAAALALQSAGLGGGQRGGEGGGLG